MEDLNNKKVLVSPYTKTSDTFKRKLLDEYPNIKFLGFTDKVQEGESIYKAKDLKEIDFDYIFVVSPNHFESIFKDLKKVVSRNKIIKIEIDNNTYKFLTKEDIFIQNLRRYNQKIKDNIFLSFSKIIDFFSIKRNKIVFISKSFIGGNNKFLFLYFQNKNINSCMLTKNQNQKKELENKNYKVFDLDSFGAHFSLIFAKVIVVDQGDCSYILNKRSKNQKTMQLWHGVPLEHMNLLTDITYDYFISTSDYVSNTSFNKVFLSKDFLSLGYPRNDVFLKNNHNESDLLFTDEEVYTFAKSKYGTDEKILVYMPTFRESDFGSQSSQYNSMPLDFEQFNSSLHELNCYMIVKLHPFVMVFFKDLIQNMKYSNIIFHNIQGDIYPILKYTDILITDYSSVYADFLLLNRPIIFFLYDHGFCSKMSHGYLYEFDEVSPGEKAYNQEELASVIKKVLMTDDFKEDREQLCDKFFKYRDENASKRILKVLVNE